MTIKTKNVTILIFIFYIFLFPQTTNAKTQITLEPEMPIIEKGKKFKIDIYIDSLREINYVTKIELNFPADLIEVSNFKFAENWLQVYTSEFSSIDNVNGKLIKTAGYPGGFNTEIPFGTVTFTTKEDRVGSISVTNKSFSLNEQKENSLSLSLPNIEFSPKKIPDDLFDINFAIDKNRALSIKDILFNINLENFGKTATPIDLYFKIYNDKNNLILQEHERIVVETENVSTKEFKNIELNPGKYKIILTTKYGNNVIDEFTKEIEIIKETRLQYVYRYKELIVLFFIVVLLSAAILIQSNKNSQNKLE